VSAQPTILVVGAGSIGTRHARNLASLGADVVVHDPDRARTAAAEEAAGVRSVTDPDTVEADGIVVASPSALHHEHLAWALQRCARVLVEKPLALHTGELDGGVRAALDRVMVGCNLRFHAPYRRVRELASAGEIGDVRGARLWFGSHLPDWRPAIDYRTTYSAQRRLGGGVLRDAIHELDLAMWCFGWPLRAEGAWIGRVGGLEIDVEDTVRAVLAAPATFPVSIELDYLSRRYRRGIEVVGSTATARFDWARAVIEVEDPGGVRTEPVTADVATSYVDEAAAFLRFVGGGTCEGATGTDGVRCVELVEQIEAIAR
jgi:predicted dehydrogenase